MRAGKHGYLSDDLSLPCSCRSISKGQQCFDRLSIACLKPTLVIRSWNMEHPGLDSATVKLPDKSGNVISLYFNKPGGNTPTISGAFFSMNPLTH